MGLIRGGLFVLASVVFFLAVLSSAMFLIVSSSLDYKIVQNQTVNLLVNQLSNQINITHELDSRLLTIENYCQTGVEYLFGYQNYTFRVTCADINKGSSSIINNTIRNFVQDIYYGNYSCNYWDCFNKYAPTFLISEKSRNYWQNWFYYSMVALLISAAALFLLIKKKRNLPFVAGGTIVTAALIILALGNLLGSIANGMISQIVNIFFSKSTFVFIRMIIIGGLLLIAGLVIELYRVEFKIYNLFSKLGEKKSEIKDKEQKNSGPKKK